MSDFVQCTPHNRCQICGKGHFCFITRDGRFAGCMTRTTDPSDPRWIHEKNNPDSLGPHGVYRLDGTTAPAPSYSQDSGVERADPDSLDRIYSALLASLALFPQHRDQLKARGLSDAEIDQRGYRSVPEFADRAARVRELRDTLNLSGKDGLKELNAVPGFHLGKLMGPSGLAIPVRDALGRIVAIKIRVDKPREGEKYLWLSSTAHGGASPGSPAHVPLHADLDTAVVRVTEGPLKADVTTSLSGMLTLGIPGASSVRGMLPEVQALGATKVLLAWDADARENGNVAWGLEHAALVLAEAGIAVAVETWPWAGEDDPRKAIDDLLAAGEQPQVVDGLNAWRTIASTVRQAGRKPRAETLAMLGIKVAEEPTETETETKPDPDEIPPEPTRTEPASEPDNEPASEPPASDPDQPDQPETPAPALTDSCDRGEYARDRSGVYTFDKNGGRVPLSTFPARITNNIREVDAGGSRFLYEIEALVQGHSSTIRVPAKDYSSLSWVGTNLGANAVLHSGRSTADQFRCAVQILSRPIPTREVYTFTGWHKAGGRWVYLHAGGGIDQDGTTADIETAVPDDLSGFVLPDPPEGDALKAAVRTALEHVLLDPVVTLPLASAAFRAVLGGSQTTVYLSALPEVGKSFHAGLAQQYFAPCHDGDHPPASVKQSTARGVPAMMARVGDAILLLDDFKVSGERSLDAKEYDKIDTIVRAQFSGSRRVALNRDGTNAASAGPSRCLFLVTGEVIPPGSSFRSRMIVIDLERKTPESAESMGLYRAAHRGVLAQAMAGFVRWLASRLDAVRDAMGENHEASTQRMMARGAERRTGRLVADLDVGLRLFLEFAVEARAISQADRQKIEGIGVDVLGTLAGAQGAFKVSQNPARRFATLIGAALASGRCHLVRPSGAAPPDAHRWGWRASRTKGQDWSDGSDGQVMPESDTGPALQPMGSCAGYLDNNPNEDAEGVCVWLIPEIALAEARRLAQDGGDPLPMPAEDLGKRLHELGLLARTELQARRTYTVRKSVGGRQRGGLLCMDVSALEGCEQDACLSTVPTVPRLQSVPVGGSRHEDCGSAIC